MYERRTKRALDLARTEHHRFPLLVESDIGGFVQVPRLEALKACPEPFCRQLERWPSVVHATRTHTGMQTTENLSKARACVQGERCRRVCSPLYNEEMEVTGPEQSERRQEDCKADIG